MINKITGTNCYINVTMDGRRIRITGELIKGGFVADASSILTWEDGTDVTPLEKSDLIEQVIAKTRDSHMVITFD